MKSVYTIPPDVPFVDALMHGMLREAKSDPLVFADSLILLPTRRACLHLREAFRRHMNGKAMLLPRMQPIGDLDEDEIYFAGTNINPDIPPAITPLRRQLLLAQMIVRKESGMPLDHAAKLAEALAHLLDEVQNERRDFTGLEELVIEKELAAHWQETVKFLHILTDAWPKVLAEEGCIDPVDRRNRVLAAQTAAWRTKPPAGRVIAAGSTGSMPATAEMLDVIAQMPNGAVILPGLDQQLPEDAWQTLQESHPQFGMKQLLQQFGVHRADVKLWNHALSPRATRVRLLNESMRPADVSDEWRHLSTADIPSEALQGLARLELDYPQEEARAIALLMRSTLEKPCKTAMLVTPDRTLAERVSLLLNRWNIRVNDSGGTPLAATPTGGFLIDLLVAASPDANPIDILSLLKHPLAAFGTSTTEFRAKARQIEIDLWRTSRITDAVRWAESAQALQHIQEMLQPLSTTWAKPLSFVERINAHRQLAERIATSDRETGSARLWHGEEGEAAATWLDDLATASQNFPSLAGADYRELFSTLSRTVTIRPAWGLHPRLGILGPLEARLIHADLVILGGLNEGAWPPEAAVDPWMSRPMKKDFGLPLPERRVGLSAHDFVQLASAQDVVMTRSLRMEGAPSVPSRFILQLETVLRSLGYTTSTKDALAPNLPWQSWAQALDEPPTPMIKPCAPPEPRPPAENRPLQLSVTEISTWQRNPYAIYARHILQLSKLDPLERDIDASDRGTIIHEALESFLIQYPKNLPDNALDELLKIGARAFAAYKDYPEMRVFWWPRFERIAAWFVETERERREKGIVVLGSEARGRMALENFTLKGRVDRMEKQPDGTFGIIDYKTGSIPSQAEVQAGIEPQLPLLALIAQAGGFEGLSAGTVSELAYWRLSGGRDGSNIKALKQEQIEALTQKARKGLEQLIAQFANPDMPYRAVPRPGLQPRYDDYAHLARLKEWGRTEEDR